MHIIMYVNELCMWCDVSNAGDCLAFITWQYHPIHICHMRIFNATSSNHWCLVQAQSNVYKLTVSGTVPVSNLTTESTIGWFMPWYMHNNGKKLEGHRPEGVTHWWACIRHKPPYGGLNCCSIMPDWCNRGEIHCKLPMSAVMAYIRGLYPLKEPCPAPSFKFP